MRALLRIRFARWWLVLTKRDGSEVTRLSTREHVPRVEVLAADGARLVMLRGKKALDAWRDRD